MPNSAAELHPPDVYVIAKSRQLNKRVTLNVGGVRHEVMWKMLESIPRSVGARDSNLCTEHSYYVDYIGKLL